MMESHGMLTDVALVTAVRDAAARGTGSEEVEKFVGQIAWLNTLRAPDRLAIKGVNIGQDVESGEPAPRLQGARDSVYWRRPLPGRNPRIVGIRWDAQGRTEVFFGVLYPP